MLNVMLSSSELVLLIFPLVLMEGFACYSNTILKFKTCLISLISRYLHDLEIISLWSHFEFSLCTRGN